MWAAPDEYLVLGVQAQEAERLTALERHLDVPGDYSLCFIDETVILADIGGQLRAAWREEWPQAPHGSIQSVPDSKETVPKHP